MYVFIRGQDLLTEDITEGYGALRTRAEKGIIREKPVEKPSDLGDDGNTAWAWAALIAQKYLGLL